MTYITGADNVDRGDYTLFDFAEDYHNSLLGRNAAATHTLARLEYFSPRRRAWEQQLRKDRREKYRTGLLVYALYLRADCCRLEQKMDRPIENALAIMLYRLFLCISFCLTSGAFPACLCEPRGFCPVKGHAEARSKRNLQVG